eukprot:m.1152714 g.1152714  ORF g.1152714 m.1152714 type:complete len:72 (-) comp24485_c0_seq3:230-445(-)
MAQNVDPPWDSSPGRCATPPSYPTLRSTKPTAASTSIPLQSLSMYATQQAQYLGDHSNTSVKQSTVRTTCL